MKLVKPIFCQNVFLKTNSRYLREKKKDKSLHYHSSLLRSSIYEEGQFLSKIFIFSAFPTKLPQIHIF